MFQINGDGCQGFWIVNPGNCGSSDRYLHHNGTVQNTAMIPCSKNKFDDGWYHTKEEAQKVLDKYLHPIRTAKHGDLVKLYEDIRIILLVDGKLHAYDQDGINTCGNIITVQSLYDDGSYKFVKNIFGKGN